MEVSPQSCSVQSVSPQQHQGQLGGRLLTGSLDNLLYSILIFDSFHVFTV